MSARRHRPADALPPCGLVPQRDQLRLWLGRPRSLQLLVGNGKRAEGDRERKTETERGGGRGGQRKRRRERERERERKIETDK